MSAELDQLRRKHEQLQASLKKVEDPTERVEELKGQLAGLEASVTSPSGKVTVVAGPGGSIRDVVFAEDAVQLPAQALAAEVKSTLAQAVATAARQQARVVDEAMGGQLGTYERVLENQAEAFGTTVDELKRTLEEATAKPVKPPRNEDDFSENTLMSKGHRPPPPTGPAASPPPGGSSAGDKYLKNLFSEDDR